MCVCVCVCAPVSLSYTLALANPPLYTTGTVQNADVIFVLEAGQVVEKGTHEQLLARENGRYAELVMKMAQA